MQLDSIDTDRVEAVLLANGAHSVTLMDAGNAPVLEPAPGETPLWPDVRISALFDADVDMDRLKCDLRKHLDRTDLPENHVERLSDRAWEREWMKDFGPMKFGQRLWVVPGDQTAPGADAVMVRLDPGLAFGTGTHATTSLCLQWLDRTDLQGKSVLDFGCGSGILGVAACKLGAASVRGIDIDLQAITASRQNAERNDVADRFLADMEFGPTEQGFDVVVANILAGTLTDHAASLIARVNPGGQLALSGILGEQIDDVLGAYRSSVEFAPAIVQDNWALLAGIKA